MGLRIYLINSGIINTKFYGCFYFSQLKRKYFWHKLFLLKKPLPLQAEFKIVYKDLYANDTAISKKRKKRN
jgi:hypothetical protein